MGGNYNEGSWSCRLIGFFTSMGADLSRPWAANLYIWSRGQDKGIWRKKRARGEGVTFDFETSWSYFGLPVSGCGLRGFPWPVHVLFHERWWYDQWCLPFRGNTPGAAIDNLGENPKELEENFRNWTLRNTNKHKKTGPISKLPCLKCGSTLSVLPVVCETPLDWRPVQVYSCVLPTTKMFKKWFALICCPQTGQP